jgi:hypothetical protein
MKCPYAKVLLPIVASSAGAVVVKRITQMFGIYTKKEKKGALAPFY